MEWWTYQGWASWELGRLTGQGFTISSDPHLLCHHHFHTTLSSSTRTPILHLLAPQPAPRSSTIHMVPHPLPKNLRTMVKMGCLLHQQLPLRTPDPRDYQHRPLTRHLVSWRLSKRTSVLLLAQCGLRGKLICQKSP